MSTPFLAATILEDPLLLFLVGLSLLVLFIWYFASERERMKRNVGTVLVLGVTGLCLLALYPPGDTLKGGIDIVGGSSFSLKVQPNIDPDTGEPLPITQDEIEQAKAIIQKRLGGGGTKDLLMASVGTDGIDLQMPGMSPEEAKQTEELLERVAKLELREVNMNGFERDPSGRSLAQRVYEDEEIIPGFKAYLHKAEDREGVMQEEYLLLSRRNIVDGSNIVKAYPQMDGAASIVGVELDGEGGDAMFRATKGMRKEYDRIAALLDDEVITAPTVNDTLSKNFVITGQKNLEESRELASQLNNPLKNPLKIEEKSAISPALGKAVVEQGVMAGVIGLGLTAVFILIYYRTAGLVALLGLTVNTVLIFGAMAMFGFTFTLPGIAGIILTIGMAVDANVLIYERLREELGHGKSLETAINTAYEKAFSAIFDANITSLIAAVILFWRASGTVQGFAVTLTVGLLSSMFSAILVTRVFFRWANDLKMLKGLSFLNLVKSQGFDFLGKRRIALVISSLLLVAAIGGFATKRTDALGVDFTGGTLIQFQLGEEVKIGQEEAQKALDGLELSSKPIIQEQVNPTTGELLTIRCDSADADKIERHLRQTFEPLSQMNPVLDASGNDTGETRWAIDATTKEVSATLGKEFFTNSLIALGIGLFAMLIYISIRFEFSFALGAFAALVHDIIVATGIVVLLGGQLSLIHVGAILAIAGYSVNDTIVVFDRIRESLLTSRGKVIDLMNEALNATLSRTILTSLTTILTVAILAFYGGASLREFSVMILVGLIVGTYSSIFVASPVVLWWGSKRGRNLRKEVLDASLAGEPEAAN